LNVIEKYYRLALRITGLLAFRRHSAAPGFRKTPFGRALRRWNALCGVLLHPQFCSPGLASQALIRATKPSPTAGTLCEIRAKLVKICIKNHTLKIFIL